jgi:hypothetical protein
VWAAAAGACTAFVTAWGHVLVTRPPAGTAAVVGPPRLSAVRAALDGDRVFVLTTDQRIWVFPEGREFDKPRPACDLACGRGFSLACNAAGACFGFGRIAGDGWTSLGCLGETTIERVFAGADHVVVLTADGRVWAWGAGAHGQLGLGDERDRAVFTLVPDLPPMPRSATLFHFFSQKTERSPGPASGMAGLFSTGGRPISTGPCASQTSASPRSSRGRGMRSS